MWSHLLKCPLKHLYHISLFILLFLAITPPMNTPRIPALSVPCTVTSFRGTPLGLEEATTACLLEGIAQAEPNSTSCSSWGPQPLWRQKSPSTSTVMCHLVPVGLSKGLSQSLASSLPRPSSSDPHFTVSPSVGIGRSRRPEVICLQIWLSILHPDRHPHRLSRA